MGQCSGKSKAAAVSSPAVPQGPALIGTHGTTPTGAKKDRLSKGYKSLRRDGYGNFTEDSNDVVVQPSGTHTHTVIMLHGLYGTGHQFMPNAKANNQGLPETVSKRGGASTNGIKYIFPTAPKRTMHWPASEGGDEPDVHAWYTYYSDKSGTMDADNDEIDRTEYDESVQQLADLVNKEIVKLGDSSKVIIGGYSQGGTTAISAAMAQWDHGIPAALIGINTVPMRFTQPNPANLALKINAFVDGNDGVYPVALQQKNYGQLESNGYKLTLEVVPGVDHGPYKQTMNDYAAQWILDAFSLKDVAAIYEASPCLRPKNTWGCC